MGSIRNLVLDDFKSALELIQKSNGYNFDLSAGNVLKESPDNYNMLLIEDATLFIDDGEVEEGQNIPNQKNQNVLDILVSGMLPQNSVLSDTGDQSDLIECLIHDIKYSIEQKKLSGFSPKVWAVLQTGVIISEWEEENLTQVGVNFNVTYEALFNAA